MSHVYRLATTGAARGWPDLCRTLGADDFVAISVTELCLKVAMNRRHSRCAVSTAFGHKPAVRLPMSVFGPPNGRYREKLPSASMAGTGEG
jgi:hypothetical protein